MLAASLKYIITIQTSSISQGDTGENTKVWTDLGQRRAMVLYGGGTKFLENDYPAQINASTVTFIFRHIDSLTYQCRIVFEDENYTIESIEKLRRREGYKVITSRNG